jgi:hypothetical protein
MGVFRSTAQRLRQRRDVWSAPAPITPFRLGLALTAPCASPRVATLAAFHRGFQAVCDTTIT